LALHDPPVDIPFIDMKTGFITRPWQAWFLINKRDKANRVENATANNIATLTSDGHPQDSSQAPPSSEYVGVSDTQELSNKTFAELVATKILSSDGSGGLSEVDLDDWIAASSGITVTDDGDGSITISVKQQSNEGDASESHTVTDPSDTPADADALRDDLVANTIPSIESALNALGVKINAVLDILLGSEIMAGP